MLLHPLKPLSPGQYNYYVAELAFYWSLMVSQFTDVKRKVSQQPTLLCSSHNSYCSCRRFSLDVIFQFVLCTLLFFSSILFVSVSVSNATSTQSMVLILIKESRKNNKNVKTKDNLQIVQLICLNMFKSALLLNVLSAK